MIVIDFLKEMFIKFIALLIVILVYCLFYFKVILVPSIVISYFFKIRLLSSTLIYVLFLSLLILIRHLLSKPRVRQQEYIPLEEYLD